MIFYFSTCYIDFDINMLRYIGVFEENFHKRHRELVVF